MAGNGDTPHPENGSEEHENHDELVKRLRELEWPKPAPGVRERALAEFERRLAEQSPDPATRDE